MATRFASLSLQSVTLDESFGSGQIRKGDQPQGADTFAEQSEADIFAEQRYLILGLLPVNRGVQ